MTPLTTVNYIEEPHLIFSLRIDMYPPKPVISSLSGYFHTIRSLALDVNNPVRFSYCMVSHLELPWLGADSLDPLDKLKNVFPGTGDGSQAMSERHVSLASKEEESASERLK